MKHQSYEVCFMESSLKKEVLRPKLSGYQVKMSLTIVIFTVRDLVRLSTPVKIHEKGKEKMLSSLEETAAEP
jgi:hypothetical protein